MVLSEAQGAIPTESRMREIHTSGSTSRGWKRTYRRRTKHRRERVRRMPRTLGAPRQPLLAVARGQPTLPGLSCSKTASTPGDLRSPHSPLPGLQVDRFR